MVCAWETAEKTMSSSLAKFAPRKRRVRHPGRVRKVEVREDLRSSLDADAVGERAAAGFRVAEYQVGLRKVVSCKRPSEGPEELKLYTARLARETTRDGIVTPLGQPEPARYIERALQTCVSPIHLTSLT
jgi:hypothetical protein